MFELFHWSYVMTSYFKSFFSKQFKPITAGMGDTGIMTKWISVRYSCLKDDGSSKTLAANSIPMLTHGLLSDSPGCSVTDKGNSWINVTEKLMNRTNDLESSLTYCRPANFLLIFALGFEAFLLPLVSLLQRKHFIVNIQTFWIYILPCMYFNSKYCSKAFKIF